MRMLATLLLSAPVALTVGLSAQSQTPATLTDALTARSDLGELLGAAEAVKFAPDRPSTLFAPNDAALKGAELPMTPDGLSALLSAHVAPRSLGAREIVVMGMAPSRDGIAYDMQIVDGQITVGGARILESVACADGSVLHVIDRVLTGRDTLPLRTETIERGKRLAEDIDARLDRSNTDNDVLALRLNAAAELVEGYPALAARLFDVENEAGAIELQIRRVTESLRFEPVREAAVPPGFPTFTPVAQPTLKSYPQYRMAIADMSNMSASNRAFFTLFNHIKENKVEMTAPVQMDYDSASERSKGTMAFLYERPDQGETGTDGAVEVIDVAPTLALSIGATGYENQRRVLDLRRQLLAWLAVHPQYEATGALRTMGYNSPMVVGGRRFFEVEIPVRLKNADGE